MTTTATLTRPRSEQLAADVSRRARERGVATALVRRLAGEAVQHGIAELRGWVSRDVGHELLGDAPIGRFHLSTSGGRCLASVRASEQADR